MERTSDVLTVTIYPDFTSCNEALWKSYRRDRIAVAAERQKSGMVKLCFREGITTNETKVHLRLSISNVVDRLRIDPELKITVDWNSWEFQINPDHLDKTTLTLGSFGRGSFASGTILRREYKLKNANK